MLFFKNIILLSLFLLAGKPHPFYLSVTDMKYNDKSKSLEIACKMFTNDLETALKKTSNKSVDILNPKNKPEVEKILFDYITKRLSVNLNGKIKNLKFIGYEKEDEVIWTYMEIEKCEKPKQVIIQNSLLYDFLKEQINLVQIEVGDFKKSSKVGNPEKELKFEITN
ncbi:MAG TPA: DUF6702 family protein [Bacteroidia bacterium]|jgi:hypothetical protein|nr:DUF6702 family protein [Bacteroidia bacterium]